MSICSSLARWEPGVVDEEDGVCPLDAVPYTLRQPSNFVGEICGPCVFIGSTYKLCVPLGFSCGRVKYPLEGYGTSPNGLHGVVGLCGWLVRVSAEGTCGVVSVRVAPSSVVGLGVVLVDGLEVLRVAPSEVLGGLYWSTACVAAQSQMCALWVGYGCMVVRRL